MKKNVLFTSLVAALLVGVLFFINKTNAQTAQLTLSVTAGSITNCTMATGINLGTIVASSSTGVISGSTRVGPNFGCTDLKGDTGRNYTMSASALAGTPAGTIANTNITLTPSGSITTSPVGACTSVTTGAGGTLNTAKNLITKANGYGQTCTFSLPSAQAKITVSVPAWTPVGTYTSTLTVVYPS